MRYSAGSGGAKQLSQAFLECVVSPNRGRLRVSFCKDNPSKLPHDKGTLERVTWLVQEQLLQAMRGTHRKGRKPMQELRVAIAAMVCVSAATFGALEAKASSACSSEPQLLASFVSGQDIPESVTTDEQGNLYVSVGNTVQVQAPGGSFGVFATLPLPVAALGVKVGPDGCVYNASTSLSAVPGAFVWRMCGAGSVEAFAELDQLGAPNDLAFDDDGSLFVTDPLLGQIWKVDEDGNAEVFLQHPLLAGNPADPALIFRQIGVNGIAFDQRHRFLYVSNTDAGSVLRIDLAASTPEPVVFAQDARLRGADGIAFDRSGKLLVAVNAQDTLVSLDKRGRLSTVASGGLLDAPSSVVFGATRQSKHTLYLTSSAFSRTLGLQPGTPQPALLTLRVGTPGLPLP
jgi:sugar lactone lactonase YvrE